MAPAYAPLGRSLRTHVVEGHIIDLGAVIQLEPGLVLNALIGRFVRNFRRSRLFLRLHRDEGLDTIARPILLLLLGHRIVQGIYLRIAVQRWQVIGRHIQLTLPQNITIIIIIISED